MMVDCGAGSTFIQLMINFIVYLFFIINAFKGKLNLSPLVHHLLVIGYVTVSIPIIMLFLLPSSPLRQFLFPALIFWMCGTIFASVLALRSNLLQLLFLLFIVFDVQFSIMQISEVLFHLHFPSRLFAADDLQLLYTNVLVLLVFLPAMWYLFLNLFRRVVDMEIDRIYWRYLVILPISAYLYRVFSSYQHTLGASVGFVAELIILLLLNVFSFLSYVVVLQMLIKSHDAMVATEKAAAAERQVLIQNAQYKKMADSVEQTERLRHDMRHHFITLKGYVENKDLEGASHYLDICIGRELPVEDCPICENHAVDMLLRYYIALAKKDGAQVRTSVQLPAKFKMPDTDLCVIFGNLVENAVESCSRQTDGEKFISIKAQPVSEEMLALTVTNSYNNEIKRRGDDFVSQKHDGLGIGTGSVKNIIEKGGGTCKFSYNQNVFKVSVLLIP